MGKAWCSWLAGQQCEADRAAPWGSTGLARELGLLVGVLGGHGRVGWGSFRFMFQKQSPASVG